MATNKSICLNFCSYYKSGSNEELACRGYLVVERLVQEGKGVVFEPSGSKCGPADCEKLAEKLCGPCDFRKDGCDFAVDRTSPPCGGFLLLTQLLAEGRITVGDI